MSSRPLPYGEACKRCRQQKVKCRRESEDTCERCKKARKSCDFGVKRDERAVITSSVNQALDMSLVAGLACRVAMLESRASSTPLNSSASSQSDFDYLDQETVEELFAIYVENLLPFCPLLCKPLNELRLLAPESFLRLAICTIASQYHPRKEIAGVRADLFTRCYSMLSQLLFVRKSSLCNDDIQAMLLLAMWGADDKELEDSKSWMMVNLAHALAVDLNLDREVADRDRDLEVKKVSPRADRLCLWMACFDLCNIISISLHRLALIKLDGIVCRSGPALIAEDQTVATYHTLQVFLFRMNASLYGNLSDDGVNRCLSIQDLHRFLSELDAIPHVRNNEIVHVLALYTRFFISHFVYRIQVGGDTTLEATATDSCCQMLDICIASLSSGGQMRFAFHSFLALWLHGAMYLVKVARSAASFNPPLHQMLCGRLSAFSENLRTSATSTLHLFHTFGVLLQGMVAVVRTDRVDDHMQSAAPASVNQGPPVNDILDDFLGQFELSEVDFDAMWEFMSSSRDA